MKTDGRVKVVTFYSHFQAMKFAAKFAGTAELRPVPRSLSSSCGDCVFLSDGVSDEDIKNKCTAEDAEAVYFRENDEYKLLFRFSGE